MQLRCIQLGTVNKLSELGLMFIPVYMKFDERRHYRPPMRVEIYALPRFRTISMPFTSIAIWLFN